MTIFPVHKNTKKSDKPLLKQILELIPRHLLLDSIRQNQSDKGCSAYKTYRPIGCYDFRTVLIIDTTIKNGLNVLEAMSLISTFDIKVAD